MSDYSGSYNGIYFGNGGPPAIGRPGRLAVSRLEGFFGLVGDLPLSDRGGNGSVAGQPRIPSKSPTLGLTMLAKSATELDGLILDVEKAFGLSAAPLPLTIGDWTMWVHAIECQPTYDPEWPGPERTTDCTIKFAAPDPIAYGPEVTITKASAASSQTVEIDNTGSKTTKPGRALQWSITAASTLVNPYVELGGRRTTWRLSMGTGQTLAIDSNLLSRIGSQIQDSRTRGNVPGGSATGSKAARWPLIPPGESEITFGAQSGTFTMVAKHRSTR